MSKAPVTATTEERVGDCLTPNRTADNLPTFFLVGDSHASNLIVTFAAATRGRAQFVYATVGHGCGFNSDAFLALSLDRCVQLRTFIWETVQHQLRANDVLVTATAHHRFHGSSDVFDTAFLASVGATVAAAGATLLVMGDSPFVAAHGTKCTSAASVGDCDAPIGNSKAYLRLDAAAAAYAQLSVANPRVLAYTSLHDLFCTDTTCGATIPGTNRIWVYDRQHMTYEGSLYAAPHVACFLEERGLIGCS